MDSIQRVKVETVVVGIGGASEEGRLVFVDESLVAVLVKLSDAHDDLKDGWHVETMFGPHAPTLGALPVLFTLDEALAWITRRLGLDGMTNRDGSLFLGCHTDRSQGQS